MTKAHHTSVVIFKTDYSEQTDLMGQLKIEDRDSDFYYCWTVSDKKNNQIATKCLSVSKQIISTETNQIEFIINHAIEGINRYRINRKKVFRVTDWTIKNGDRN